jgi:hypothetical protein
MGSIFGLAKKGFGMLKKGKKGIDLKKRREVFKKASQKADYDQTVKKAKRLISEGEAAIKKRLMSPHPLTPISKGKKWVGRINPDGTHVRPKKASGGMLSMMGKLSKIDKESRRKLNPHQDAPWGFFRDRIDNPRKKKDSPHPRDHHPSKKRSDKHVRDLLKARKKIKRK